MNTRVRFAPSPTGLLHVGGARTALFNWLFARHVGGKLVLRIEDTDHARNTQEAVDVIFSGLKWLGLDWDEGPQKGGDYGPYFQSQRREIYQLYVKKLLDANLAYDDKGAIRFRFPKKGIRVKDMICGDVDFDLSLEPDMTIVRPDGSFIFHLVNVVDDLEMKITHVIRGEDHLSNTPKHLALFEAFGVTPPSYGHIPLILNRDGSKMSKRDAGAAVGDYITQGFIPAAVRNYLCLLGWSPKDDQEILPIEEVIQRFELSNINRSNARFDMDKLLWMNTQHVLSMSQDTFNEQALSVLEKSGLLAVASPEYVKRVLAIIKEKTKLLSDLPNQTIYFFKDDFPVDEESKNKVFTKPNFKERLRQLCDALSNVAEWSSTQIETCFKGLATSQNIKVAEFVHPARFACSGRSIGPSLYHMLEVLGKEKVLQRLGRIVNNEQ